MNTRRSRSTENPDELLTPEEAARRLNVSERTIERWQHDGTLPFLRLGQTVRFHWPTVVAHLLEHFSVCKLRVIPPQADLRPRGPGGGR
jgi:excisionase family DNA binding protein